MGVTKVYKELAKSGLNYIFKPTVNHIVQEAEVIYGLTFEESYQNLKQTIKNGPYRIEAIHDSKDINRLVKDMGYYDPPHHAFYATREIITTKSPKDLVRVFTYDNDGIPSGHFLTTKSEIEGLSRAEIRAKLAIDFEPTHIADANIPKNVRMYISIVGENYKQPGGGIQMQLIEQLKRYQRDAWFGNVKELGK